MTNEFEHFSLGAKKDKKDKRDYRIAGITKPLETPVHEFELSDIFPSKNQGGRPSCTSQMQSHHKERQEKTPISARMVMAFTKDIEGNTEEGAYTRNTFKVVHKVGACREELYPEPDFTMSWEEYIDISNINLECRRDALNHRSQSYWRVDKNIEALKTALVQHKNSIGVSMAWYKEFNQPGENGLLIDNYKEYVGGHAVEFKGFSDNKQTLKFKNSWGEAYGDEGDFLMPYAHFKKLVWDCWCSLDIPEDLPVDVRYGQKRTWSGFLREKSIAFNPWLYGKIRRLPTNREINGLAYGFHSFKTVFRGEHGDIWLKITRPEAIKRGLIK